MERMSGPMLVVRAASYTMSQIAQYWKQTFGSSHSLHSIIGSILWSGTKNQQPADYLPTPTLEAGRSSFVIRASATRCVECFQYPTLEVFDATCSRGLSSKRPRVVVGKIMNYTIQELHWNSDRWRYKSARGKITPVLGQPLYLWVTLDTFWSPWRWASPVVKVLGAKLLNNSSFERPARSCF